MHLAVRRRVRPVAGALARRRKPLCAALVLCAAFLLLASLPASAAQLGTGGVSGTVTDNTTHQPVAGIEVQVEPSVGGVPYTATTAADGTYTVTGLPPGNYFVEFDDSTGTYVSPLWWPGVPAITDGDTQKIVVADSTTTTGVDVALLHPFGTISGTVTDSQTHSPIAGDTVTAYTGLSFTHVAGTAITDGNGNYDIQPLPVGVYVVGFNGDATHRDQFYPGEPEVDFGMLEFLGLGQNLAGLDAALDPTGSIGGNVVNSVTSAVASGVAVTAYDANGNVAGTAATDPNGNYTLKWLDAGTYRVSFGGVGYHTQFYSGKSTLADADPVVVNLGQTTGVSLAVAPYGSIGGTVTDAITSAAIPNITVTALDQSTRAVVGTATTDANGNYVIQGLSDGSYYIDFSGDASHAGQKYGALVTALSGTPTTGVDAALMPYGTITGTVTDAVTHNGIASDSVTVFDANGSVAGTASTDANGAYTVHGLPAGSYRVGFSDSGHFAEYYADSSSLDTADSVTVGSGAATAGIDVSLVPFATISGTVTDAATHNGIADTGVTVYDALGNVAGTASTDADGNYSVTGLAAGNYRLAFAHSTYTSQYYDGASSLADASQVSASAGVTTTGIDAALVALGGLSGTVTDGASHAALPNIAVTVYSANGDVVATTTTDANGAYTVSHLEAGQDKVRFSDPGSFYATQYYNGEPSLDAADPVTIADGQTTSGIDIALQGTGAISGTVTDALTTNAIAGITVKAFDANSVLTGTATTDANGSYTVSQLPTGSYTVEFADPNNSYPSQYYNDTVAVSEGQTTTGIDAAMISGGRVTGTVTDALTHNAIAGISVSAEDANGVIWGFATTNADGHYTVSHLPTGTFTLQFVDQSGSYAELTKYPAVSVTAGATTTGIDEALAPLGRITGTLTDASTHAGIAGAYVYIYNAAGTQVLAYTQTAADGTYSASRLPTGSYLVDFLPTSTYPQEFYAGKGAPASADPVSVTSGQTTSGIDLALYAGTTMTGTVTDSSTHAALANVAVTLYDSNDNPVSTTTTASDGTYAFQGLGVGTYELGFASANYVTVYYSEGSTLAQATPIAVTDPILFYGLDAALTSTGAISGTVRDGATNDGLGNITVTAMVLGQTVGTATTADDGTYTVPDLLPGQNYVVEFSDSAHGYNTQYYDGVTNAAQATLLTVTGGATTSGIDASMGASAGAITGTAEDAFSHQPARGLQVSLYNTSNTLVATTGTGPSGEYMFSNVTPGTYKVGFVDNTKVYAPQFWNDELSLTSADAITVGRGQTVDAIDANLVTKTTDKLTVIRAGSGIGTVTSSPAGIDCGATCAIDFNNGNAVTLTATPASGSRFAGWAGGGCTGMSTCQVAMIAPVTVKAIFSPASKLSPEVDTFSPLRRPIGAGAVEIDGSHFTGLISVKFGAVTAPAATVHFVSDTEIDVSKVPAGAASGKIKVTTVIGSGLSPSAFTVQAVSAFAPLAAKEGSTVTITGSGFTNTSAVAFDGTAAASFLIVSSTKITAVVDAGTQTGNVTVTTSDGTSASEKKFKVVPTLSGFSPARRPVGGSVTLTGTGLAGVTAVKLNGRTAAITSADDTSVTVTVPLGARTGKIAVTTPGGTATSAASFVVQSITSFSPLSGKAGTRVTIVGTGLSGATAVAFDGTPATSYIVVSSTKITAVVAEGTAKGQITVTTPDGTARSAKSFSVLS